MTERIKIKSKKAVEDILDRRWIGKSRKNEIKKFQDPRRKKIYEAVNLTKDQKEEIDRLYLENYGNKIPYIWHRYYTAFTGKFSPYYIPELIYIPEFEHFMNLEAEYTQVFSDKNVLPLMAKAGGVKMAHAYVSCIFGIYHDHEMKEITRDTAVDILKNIGEVFIKPTIDTNSGRGCFIADFESGMDVVSGKRAAEILESLGDNFTIQERIHCHDSVAALYPHSVNTFRVITYRWQDKYLHMPVLLRIGRGGNFLDNAHAGGMFIAIEDDGMLHKKAFTEFKEEMNCHPDTGVFFEGYRIEAFPRVLRAAESLCSLFSQVGCINWDFSIDEKGQPVLIEANMRGGSVWLSEISHGCGPFGELTPEILRWMRHMKSVKKSERGRYRFGRMV